jgi:hypothetical protein
VVACVALAGCDLPLIETGTPAYDPATLTDGQIYHWPTGAEVMLFVDESSAPPEADLSRAVREAAAAWNAVGRLGEVRLGVTSNIRAADIIVHHALATPGVVTGECEPPAIFGSSYTHFCPHPSDPTRAIVFPLADGTGGRVKMLVSVNRGVVDSEDIFRAHVAHELGHVLGIGAHSPEPTDLMFGVPRRLTPSAADAQTLRYVLGQAPDIRF